jgi:hypothetical protein
MKSFGSEDRIKTDSVRCIEVFDRPLPELIDELIAINAAIAMLCF